MVTLRGLLKLAVLRPYYLCRSLFGDGFDCDVRCVFGFAIVTCVVRFCWRVFVLLCCCGVLADYFCCVMEVWVAVVMLCLV